MREKQGGNESFGRVPALFLAGTLIVGTMGCTPNRVMVGDDSSVADGEEIEPPSVGVSLDTSVHQKMFDAEEAAREARVEARRARGRTDDRLQCAFDTGEAWFPSGRSAVEANAFEIVRGEVLPVALKRKFANETMPLWLHYADSGLTMRLCRTAPWHVGADDCAAVAGTRRDFVDGLTWTVTLPDFAKLSLHCATPPGPPVVVNDGGE